MLDRLDPPGGEGSAVAYRVDPVDDGVSGIARQQEVRMRRVDRAVGGHRVPGGYDGVSGDFAAERPGGLARLGPAPEQVGLQPFQMKDLG